MVPLVVVVGCYHHHCHQIQAPRCFCFLLLLLAPSLLLLLLQLVVAADAAAARSDGGYGAALVHGWVLVGHGETPEELELGLAWCVSCTPCLAELTFFCGKTLLQLLLPYSRNQPDLSIGYPLGILHIVLLLGPSFHTYVHV